VQHRWQHYVIQPRSQPDFQISAFSFKYRANVNSGHIEIVKFHFAARQRKILRTPLRSVLGICIMAIFFR